MSETTKAVNPPKDNKKRYSNRQGAKKSTANKNEQKSGTTVQRSNTSSTHVTSKKLFIDTNGMTNLQKWRENQETELGAKYGAMVASVFNSNYHKVILPKRCMKAERMLDEAEEVQRQIQIDAGVAPEDIQFEFDTYTLDEVLNEFSPENLNIDFYNMVGGLSEDELSEFQEHLDQLYQQELKVYRNRLQAVKSDSEKLFSDIVNSLSENSFNAVKDADGDWDTLRAEADPVKLMKLINETHYLDAQQVKSQQRTKVRNAFYRDFRMRTNQQVSSFRKEFEWHQAMFEKVGLSMGEDDEIAEIFIDKLHEGYDGLRDEQERLEKNGVGNPPSNLKEAYQFRPVVRSVQLAQCIILRLMIDRQILKEAQIDFVMIKIKVKVMGKLLKTLVRQILAMLKIKIKRNLTSPTPVVMGLQIKIFHVTSVNVSTVLKIVQN